ncbi:hypothetical protein Mpet_2079 [Methanolacinia petrolearia DSM 11571]|uniref:Uncharacterized protein n=1 Tax=Methanolacinia petrolearia (strain DSM 11571 / OCM 486 / SEBR 4847) TaxID=679926 RepID=E1RJU3_METP4|nr:hypothetical protein Mpet_2079 [Methanolacinia petrolearia DSM 11571]
MLAHLDGDYHDEGEGYKEGEPSPSLYFDHRVN